MLGHSEINHGDHYKYLNIKIISDSRCTEEISFEKSIKDVHPLYVNYMRYSGITIFFDAQK